MYLGALVRDSVRLAIGMRPTSGFRVSGFRDFRFGF